MWFWRGLDIPFEYKDHPSYEYHTITKLDHSKPEDRALLEEYWLNLEEGAKVEGLTVQEAKYFK